MTTQQSRCQVWSAHCPFSGLAGTRLHQIHQSCPHPASRCPIQSGRVESRPLALPRTPDQFFSIFFFWPGRPPTLAKVECGKLVADCAPLPSPLHSYIFGTPPTIPPPSPPNFFLFFSSFPQLPLSASNRSPQSASSPRPRLPPPKHLTVTPHPPQPSPFYPPQNIAIVHPL